MSKTNAIAMAVLALQEAAAFEQEAELVQPRQPSDPSGSDDVAALAEDQRAALRKAAEGRAGDALVALYDVYPAAFARVAQQPPASVPVGELAKLTDIVAPLVDANGQPANPPLSDLATAIANPGTIEPPAPAAVDPTGGPIAEPAPVAPQDPSAPTNG